MVLAEKSLFLIIVSLNSINQIKFDQKEIDEALDKKRSDEILHGGDITEVKNEDLFVIDTGKSKKKEPVKREFSNIFDDFFNRVFRSDPC